MRSRILGLTALVSVCGFAVFLNAGTQLPTKKGIPALIDQLASDSYAKREEATRLLGEMNAALPALREATRSKQLERSRRATQLVARLRRRCALAAQKEFIRRGAAAEIDLFIDHLTAWPDLADEGCSRLILEWKRAATAWAEKAAGGKSNLPKLYQLRLPFVWDPWRDGSEDPGDPMPLHKSIGSDYWINNGILVCGGTIGGRCWLRPAMLLANRDVHHGKDLGRGVTIFSRVSDLFIFCDGDVEVDEFTRTVIIATGEVRYKACDEVSVAVRQARQRLMELRLFDIQQVGVGVSDSEKSAWVVEVQCDSIMGRAGLRRGDRVLAVGKDAVTSAEGFRKLIRKKVAEIDEAVIEICRAGKVLHLTAHF